MYGLWIFGVAYGWTEHAASKGNDRCPGCNGWITFTADASNGVTVDYHCVNGDCDYGNHYGLIPAAV